jgi:hypothetical protein
VSENWMSGCQPDSAGGLPACPDALFARLGSLAAESAKLADIPFEHDYDHEHEHDFG